MAARLARIPFSPMAAAFALALAVALMLRLWKLGVYEPIDDEFIYMVGLDDRFAHPPLFAWIFELVRERTDDLALLRLPSLLFGMAGLACLTGPFVRQRDWGSAAWIATWCGLALFHIRLSQTIKGFVLLSLMVTVAHLLLIAILDRPRRDAVGAYCVACAAVLWADYIGIIAVVADLAILLVLGRWRIAGQLAAFCALAAAPMLPWVWDGIGVIRQQPVLPWTTVMEHAGTIFFGIGSAPIFVCGTIGLVAWSMTDRTARTTILAGKLALCWLGLLAFHLTSLHIAGRHLALVFPLWGLLLGYTSQRWPIPLRWGVLAVYAALQLQHWPAYHRQTPVNGMEYSWYSHRRAERSYQLGRWLGGQGDVNAVAIVRPDWGLPAIGVELGLAAARADRSVAENAATAPPIWIGEVVPSRNEPIPPGVSHVLVAAELPPETLAQAGITPRCRQVDHEVLLEPFQTWWECGAEPAR